MSYFIPNLVFFSIVLTLTVLVGYPLTRFMNIKSRLTNFFLSFSLGFSVISLTGILSNTRGLPVFSVQLLIIISLLLISLYELKRSEGIHVKLEEIFWIDSLFLLYTMVAAILLIHIFSQIIMWAESDVTFHASLIRDITGGVKIPQTIVPGFGGAHEDFVSLYPKGFHFYSAFFIWLFDPDFISAVKILPLVPLTMVPFGVYVLLKEARIRNEIALFAFLLTFLQYNHIFPLFFGLYPSMTVLVFILSIMIILIGDRSPLKARVLHGTIILITLYFVHPKYLLHSFLIAGWVVIWKHRKANINLFSKYFLLSLAAMGIILTFFSRASLPTYPEYLSTYMTRFSTVFIPEWYLSILALPGLLLLSIRREKKDWLILGWFILWFSLAFLNDTDIFQLSLTPERTYQELYLPISILAGYALFATISSPKEKKTLTFLVFIFSLLTFPLILGSVFITYAPNLSMSLDDYTTMKTLEGKKGIVINLDPTGRWIYPLTGLFVTNPPRGMNPLFNNSEKSKIIDNPSSEASKEILNSLNETYGDVYVFISQRSSGTVVYNIFGNEYPSIDIEKFKKSSNYIIFAEKNGSILFKYK